MSPIILGVWPLAGITSGNVDPDTAQQTIHAAIDVGIDTFDSAYSYGYDGESENLLGDVLRQRRCVAPDGAPLRVIGKVGQRWTRDKTRYTDGTPKQLTLDAEESLRRLGIEKFDWLMLHAVDPKVDLMRSASALDQLRRRGLADALGICNINAEELLQFSQHVRCAAIQCPLNLLQRHSSDPLIRTAAEVGANCFVYWTLMKGLLAGKIGRDHQFDVGDSRPGYEIFQGEKRRRAHDVIDILEAIATRHETTIARLAIGWALSQPGVTAALVGAKSPEQIRETALAKPLSSEVLREIADIAP
jgi:aryl-alcohol dehydrogenase-like predicted oxidoreductase